MKLTYSHDAQAPNVNLGSILLTSDDLRGHPIRGPNHRRTLRICWIGDLRTEPKVGYGGSQICGSQV
jgi:hypothetical protein